MKSIRILVASAAALLAVSACGSDGGNESTPSPTTVIEGVETFNGLSRNHVTGPVAYPQSPPVGGDHSPVWQNCGFYDTPIGNENAVHSMEHGAVWLAFRPDLPADEVAVLRALARGRSHVLVSPYVGLTEPVVATAWGKQLRLDDVNDPRLAQFVATYEQGPQTPEPGAPCSGGLGEPLE